MTRHAVMTLILVLTTATAHAESLSFDFKDPKGVNSINFLLDSELEPISGVVHDITGTVEFDPKKPKATKGTIVAAAKSIHVPNGRMKGKLQTEQWLDLAKNPEVRFTVKSVKSAKAGKNGKVELVVVGLFSMRGVEKEMTVAVTLTHLPGKLKERNHRGDGDLLALRTRFKIKRSEFKLGPPMPLVADEIEITVAIVGTHAKK